jgi:thioredoxin reductase
VFRGRRVIIIGGGDSAFDWAYQLAERAAFVTLVHRSDRFRAHAATVRDVQSAVAAGRAEILTFHELHDVLYSPQASSEPANGSEDGTGQRMHAVVVRDTKRKTTREIPVDAVLPMLGFVSDLGALAEWGLMLTNDEIVVSSTMETGRAGIYAAGDIATYPGKLKLIATGFGEAAVAVNQAVHWIYPEKKVTPGHSSNMALFGQTDD